MSTSPYSGWACLELMGHRQRFGRVSEAEMYGGKMLRIDIPVDGADPITEFYGVTSIYALTPCSEEICRDRMKSYGDPRPVKPMEYRLEDKRRSAYDDRDPEAEDFEG